MAGQIMDWRWRTTAAQAWRKPEKKHRKWTWWVQGGPEEITDNGRAEVKQEIEHNAVTREGNVHVVEE